MPPKIEPKSVKSEKKGFKIDIPKKYVFQYLVLSILRRFVLRKRSQNWAVFATFSNTSILWKSLIFFSKENYEFWGSEPPKFHAKSIPKHGRKKHRKKAPKIDVGIHFGFPKPSKIATQKLQNRSVKRCQTKLALRSHASHPESVASRRKPEIWDCLPGKAYD